ncbi:SDR family NAD(P)-dependent oxidoreductase [Litoreibacter janthinus]|uniref:NAD(P)-dependent dehydrogenase, short-chain alcohol dehydrogenase family n=1 Tax=Litoreibacter janthinus TaxID=670154 RepID=A0A1I6FSS9_9RHOB|nr:SDR family NAD(P)-dependent oxidoreductase [Litoreibacter janthinus]SFR32999.1 NAD(P)-dependent dehydrogenase, short-chain alcohol dehydrogenase family [Litoreibacter janthinus]
MTRTLIIGASGGIGTALTQSAQQRGHDVVGLSRSQDGLDVTDEASIKRAVATLSGSFDLIICTTGALVIDGHEPEKSIHALSADALTLQFQTNAMGPALVLKHVIPLLPKNRPATFAALSARVGSIGDNKIGGWHSYRAAKAALNQLIHGAAIELARTHKQATCVCLHPGTVETPFTAKYAGHHKTVPADQAAANLLDVLGGLTPSDTGKFFDYSGAAVPW